MVRFHPGSLMSWSVSVPAARLLGKEEDRVQFPDGPSTEHGTLACAERRAKGIRNTGCSSNGKTPGLQPGNRGSIPRQVH